LHLSILDRENITNFLPVKSAAAFTLPSRCKLDANWVVMTLPLEAEICRNNASATTDSLIVLPGESTFVESLIICKVMSEAKIVSIFCQH